MEKIKVIYAFDNIKQYKFATKSIESVKKKNSSDEISFVFMFNDNIGDSEKKHILEITKGYEIFPIKFDKSFMNNSFKVAPGMFYWLFAPYKVEGKKFIQLDNDTLINTSLSNLFKKYSKTFEKNIITGAKTNIRFNFSTKEKLKLLNLKSNKKLYGNYVNYGVLLFNADLYRNEMNEKDLKDYIEIKTILGRENRIYPADQEWMFEFFSKHTGFLSHKFNARIHRRSNLYEAINHDDFILHYNFYYSDKDNKRKKFDFQTFMFDENLMKDAKVNMLMEAFNPKQKRKIINRRRNIKYSNKIVEIFENLTN